MGPLPSNMVGIILGRSNTTKKGIFAFPGVTDTDNTREIQIMLKATRLHVIPKYTQLIAQLKGYK